jgi:hypothetical protein
MSPLAEHAERYLALRRAVGFKLLSEGQLLAEFVASADAAGQRTINHAVRTGMGEAPDER